MPRTVTRYHDICAGHRVHGHESKCAHLHGHNYRIHFTVQEVEDNLDPLGRVVDFSVVKEKLCEWVEKYWDHKMLISTNDPFKFPLLQIDPRGVVLVPFNPTAENMAEYLVDDIGPAVLPKHLRLIEVRIEETAKCSATYRI